MRVFEWCVYVWYIYYENDPEDELQVVDGVQSDDDDQGDEVVFLLDVEDGLEAVPEADRHQRDHRREDVPILEHKPWTLDRKFLQLVLYEHHKKCLAFIW